MEQQLIMGFHCVEKAIDLFTTTEFNNWVREMKELGYIFK